MPNDVTTINFGGVNCYLIKTSGGYILIDTGFTKNRKDVMNKLESLGCRPGNLQIILITHGDADHTGNAAYLRHKFGVQIGMHKDDSRMVENGDLLWGRKVNPLLRIIGKMLQFPPFGLRRKDRFKADLYMEDGFDLNSYGLEAKVVYIPGHSSGSVGILRADGELYCGDLFMNTKIPRFSNVNINRQTAEASVNKLKGLNVKTVYPGHGQPFPWEQFVKNYQQ
jgi:hydroxyacylglutathione hydrolase